MKFLFKKVKAEFLKLLRYYFRLFSWQGKTFKIDIDINYKWYGNEYGGFYVADILLDKDSIIYSVGIGEDISFDKAINSKYGCKVFMFDPTPKSIKWVSNLNLNNQFVFHEYGLYNETCQKTFYLPKKSEHISGSLVQNLNVNSNDSFLVNLLTIEDISKIYGHSKIDVLKIDIEGAEYDVLDSILNSKLEITQILIEFHSRFLSNGIELTKTAVGKLHNSGYKIFAFSKTFEEVSFIKTVK